MPIIPGPFHPSATRRLWIRVSTLTATCILALCAQAQIPTADSFNPDADGTVNSLAIQPDGKILAGGNFTSLGGQPRNCIGRLNADGTLDKGFNPGASSYVRSLAMQADGKILVGGNFRVFGGQRRDYTARLNANGTLDSGFNPGANSVVYSQAIQADGKILVGGDFTFLGGQLRDHIGRLNADGTLDSGFNPRTSYPVDSLAIQVDGKILLGGIFYAVGGQPRNHIARLNADGSVDSSFNPGADTHVLSLALQADGKILLGGGFTTLGGQPRNYIARLNATGSVDNGFNPGANNAVYSLAIQADGKILAVGGFTTLGGQPRNGVARLNADGTLDSGFNPAANGSVSSLAIQADGKILVGGGFTTLGGQPRNNLARLNNTEAATQSLSHEGSTITWLRGGTSPEVWRTTFEHSVDGLAWSMLGGGARIPGGWQLTNVSLPSTGTLRARGFVSGGVYDGSGWFVEDYLGSSVFISQPASQTNYAGETITFQALASSSPPLAYQWFKNGIALPDGGDVSGAASPTLTLSNLLHTSAGGYSVMVSNSQGSITSLVAQLTVIDPFISVQPVSQFKDFAQSAVFSLSASGTPPLEYQWWHNGLLVAGATNASLSLTNLQSADAGEYVATVHNPYGSVTSAVAHLIVNLALLDSAFLNPGANGTVYSLAIQADGKILVGGDFTTLGGQPRNHIARLNADGTLDSAFNPGAGSYVDLLAIQADGKILVGGWFTTLGGQPRNHIARLNADGTLDSAFNPEPDSSVLSLAIQADGKILAGGAFTTFGGQPRNSIARLNANGTVDSFFNPGADNSVISLALQADGKILVGGYFNTLGGQLRNSIARLNYDGALDSGFNPGVNGSVNSLALQADGKILAGGLFTALGGQPRNSIARLNADGTLDSGFNPGANGSVSSLALQADGKILVGGDFTVLGGQPRNSIARLNANGSVDSGFNPGANGFVFPLGIQVDGKILVGGGFLARLHNTDVATHHLSHEGSTITWLRGGTSPEVWRTTFEHSADGLAWSLLGTGGRNSGGWQLTKGTLPSTGTLRARGFISTGSENGSSWFVEDYFGSLIFLFQPDSRTNNAAETGTFRALAEGSQPMSYQWLKDGVALVDGAGITGAASPTLVLSNLLHASEGGYSVIVSNSQGSLASLVAHLTVIEPLIAVQPVNQSKEMGQSVMLNVSVTGTQPLQYQWWRNAELLAGATNATLSLSNLQRADAGDYFAIVRNPYGSVTSAVASLTLSFLDSGVNAGANSIVYSLAVQANGKILAGGLFTTLGGLPRNFIARLNADGSLDNGFNPGANGNLNSLALQADGKILAGGLFTTLGGLPRNFIARLNADGSLDNGFNPGANNIVNSLTIQADGKILVGGGFTTFGGQMHNRVARLNADGSLDNGFNPGANNIVNSLAIQADGKILAGGAFTSFSAQSRNYIARLNADGTLDNGFTPGANSIVYSLAVQADGKILLGGVFTSLGGQPRNGVARLNGDGTLDSGFDPEPNGPVYSLALQADGRILMAGFFTTVGGQPRNYMAQLNGDGTLDSTFDPEANSVVNSLALQADGKILLGGGFTTLFGQPRNRIARLHNTGAATQNLTLDGSAIAWLRGGTSPEISHTTFEHSVDGFAWSILGTGARIPGGWQLTNVSLPSTGTLRTRGYVAGGFANGSGWFVETLWPYGPSLAVVPQRNVGSDGTTSFTLRLEGVSDTTYTLQSTTNLAPASTWSTVWTGVLSNSVQALEWTNRGETQRYFRVLK